MGLPIVQIAPGEWKTEAIKIQKNFNAIKTHLLGPGASPTFAGLTLSGLAASLLVATDANKAFASVTDLTAWIAGTSNQIIVTDDGDGTLTLSAPQNLHTGATPEFAGMNSTGNITLTLGQKLYFDGG